MGADANFKVVASTLSLAEIETRLRNQGCDQSAIDKALRFIIEVRERLAAEGHDPRHDDHWTH